MRRKIGLLGIVTLLLLASPAMADTVDSWFVEGYDPDGHNLVWGAGEVDEDGYDCAVAAGPYQYVADAEGLVTSLKQNGVDVTYRFGQLGSVTAPYGQTGGACDLDLIHVAGPNGQVNHGQVVSSFVHALKEAGVKGKGCMVRYISGSAYGKEDQGIVTGAPVLAGDVELATHLVACGGGAKKDQVAAESQGNGRGNGNGRGDGKGGGNGNGRP
jgi:hypothetical protein